MEIDNLRKKIESKKLNFNSTLSESEIIAFESNHRVSLPEDYRNFLLKIGNGGDGPPYYKWLPLGKASGDSNEIEKEIWEGFIYINKEFPYSESWCWEDQESEDFEKKIESAYFGSVMLGTDGCGMNWLLIVTGESHGEIWQISDAGIIRCEPKMNFTEWYEYWLENEENTNYFG
jgi:hypothetical protein